MKTRSYVVLCLTLMVTAGVLPAGAARVTTEQASRAARTWIRSGCALDRRMGTAVDSVKEVTPTNGSAFHVVSLSGGGFVVMGTDTGVEPIIAFSSSGKLVEDRQNPLWVLLQGDLAARQRHVVAKGRMLTASSSAGGKTARPIGAEALWAELLAEPTARTAGQGTGTSSGGNRLLSAANGSQTIADVRVEPLLATAWSQKDYRNYGYTGESDICYNYYTPNHWPCGCVATAGAQVMRYHSYPTSAVVAGTYACRKGGSPVDLTMYGGTYNWDAMTLVPANGCSAISREAIGRLTYDVGVTVGMSYGSGGSSSAGYMLSKRFVDRFQYANAVSVVFQNGFFRSGDCSYTLARFKSAVIPNFDAGLPVVLGISGSGGHAVVGDGYGYANGNFYLHINLGWANQDNGNAWYMPPNIERYTSIDSIVYNVYPTGASGASIVSGRILSAEGLPVEGASVRAVADGAVAPVAASGARGTYALKVSPGTYWIVAERDGQSASNRVTVSACVSPHLTEDGSYYDDICPQVGNICDIDLTLSVSLPEPDPEPEPEPEDPMDVAVGSPGLTWTTGKDYPWTVSDDYYMTGEGSLRSDGTVTNKYGASSWLKTTVAGPVELGFRYAKTLYGCSFTVECDGEPLYEDTEGGHRTDWKLAIVDIPTGSHEITFRFTYKGGYYYDFNGIWLDEVGIDRYSCAPEFSPATTTSETSALTFTGSQQITISADDGATVHYTDDGSEPTEDSPVYSGPITLTKTTYLRAIAVSPGKSPGVMAEALYISNDPVEPGEWTTNVDGVRDAAKTGGNLIAVLYANLATCMYCRQLDPLIEGAEFTAWAKENGIYLVSADQSRYPYADKALSWFSSVHHGTTYWPTIVFFNAWEPDTCIGEGVFRYGETVKGITYTSTLASLKECFSSFLSPRPDPGHGEQRETYHFNGNGATSGSMDDFVVNGEGVPPNQFRRTGYTFLGWSLDPDATEPTWGDGDVLEAWIDEPWTNEHTLYAVWQPNSYAVHFEPNGADEGEMADQAFVYDVAQTLASNRFVKAGWTFAGWTARVGASSVAYADGEAVSNLTAVASGAVTLTATWEAIPYTLVYAAGGGIGEPYATNLVYDSEHVVEENWFVKEDAMFLGWTDAAGNTYQPGDVVSNLTTVAEDVVTFTAKWCDDSATDEQVLTVSGQGWHEVSFSVLPDGGLPEDVFAPVEDKVGYVTYGSLNWSPLAGGTLMALEIGKGYWLQTTADNVSWTVTGQTNPDVEIALKPGWNLIGYPLLEEGEVETVLATALATGKIDWIYSGSRVYPGTLTTMVPGKGYWVYANAAGTIRFDVP